MDSSETARRPGRSPVPPGSPAPADRTTAARLAEAGRFAVVQASRSHWRVVQAWADHEGCDAGLGDPDFFFWLDPAGFFLGLLDGEPVSAISVVNYGPALAFLGNYLVRPAFRGRGIGTATWRAALTHAAGRTVGLEAAPAQAAAYRAAGFAEAYDTIGYRGEIRPLGRRPVAWGTAPFATRLAPAAAAFDRSPFALDREEFTASWSRTPGHRALVRYRNGELTGYGVLRPSVHGYRVGPLVAATEADALALFDALTEPYPGAMVSLHIPEPNRSAALFASALGLKPTTRTVRMYSRTVGRMAFGRCFGIASLAYG